MPPHLRGDFFSLILRWSIIAAAYGISATEKCGKIWINNADRYLTHKMNSSFMDILHLLLYLTDILNKFLSQHYPCSIFLWTIFSILCFFFESFNHCPSMSNFKIKICQQISHIHYNLCKEGDKDIHYTWFSCDWF